MNCTDPMDELVAVSEEAGLYEDPCPDCDGGRIPSSNPVLPSLPCPSCDGTRPANVYANDESKSTVQTRPAVTDEDVWKDWRDQMPRDFYWAYHFHAEFRAWVHLAQEVAARARQENR